MFLSPCRFAFLRFHAAKCCVDVRIVGLEPVSERPAEHARRCSRRATLHHVVLAIKEIRRISRIKLSRGKAFKWRELRPRPFPPVSHQVVHAERARAFWLRPNGQRLPSLKIKISVLGRRNLVAPGIQSLVLSPWRSVRCTMKLRLARQLSSQTVCIRACFRVAHIHRPLQRQANFAEHCPVHPQISRAMPKSRMLYSFAFLPLLRFTAPKRLVLITARLHKLQEFAVRHVEALNCE